MHSAGRRRARFLAALALAGLLAGCGAATPPDDGSQARCVDRAALLELRGAIDPGAPAALAALDDGLAPQGCLTEDALAGLLDTLVAGASEPPLLTSP